MKKCIKCGTEIDENNRVLRENGRWRGECRKCRNATSLLWAKKNSQKRKVIRTRYDRKIGKGINYPCQRCGKMLKRTGGDHFCSDKCRFLQKIEKKENGCWEWSSQTTKAGYGKFNIRGTTMLAHRYSYQLYNGEIAKNMCVCHSCDNPKCVNPEHLWIGSHKENYEDMVKKGRRKIAIGWTHTAETRRRLKLKKGPDRKGIKHHLNKFTEEDIFKIREMCIEGIKQVEIAKVFKCDASHISRISRRKSWSHI